MIDQSEAQRQTRRSVWRVAAIVQRFPWLTRLLRAVMHLWQPRFTVGVVGVLPDAEGKRVLLVEHVYHQPHSWGLPGGWIGRGEDPARCVEREFLEETGLHVRAVMPLAVALSPEWRRHLNLCYLCALADEPGTLRLSTELLSSRWTPFEALPPLPAFHVQALQVARQRLISEH